MKPLFAILFFLNVCFCYAQVVLFQKAYGGSMSDIAYSVQQTTDGGFVIGGYSESFTNGTNDFYIVKTNSIGDTLWTKIYGGLNEDYGRSILQTSDGGYVLAGFSDNISTKPNVVLMKMYSDGNLQWSKTIIGTNEEYAYSLQPTSDNGFIVGGSVLYTSTTNYDSYLIKTDSNGDTLWTKVYGGIGAEQAYSVQQTIDGGYIIAGSTTSFGSGANDVYLIKTDLNGDTLWTRTYGGTKNDEARYIQQTFDAGYIITGLTKSFGPATNNVYLIKTNSNGDSLWTKIIGNGYNAYGNSVQQTSDGYIISGGISYSGQNNDAYLIKTDSNGDTLWTKTYGNTGVDWFQDIKQTMDNGFIITGVIDKVGPMYFNYYLVKIDSLGNTSPLVGVQEQEPPMAAGEITIYPNPFSTQANLVLPGEVATNGEAELVIYDVPGNETARVKITAQRALIQRDNLKAGLYFCKVISNNTIVATGKFIIQ